MISKSNAVQTTRHRHFMEHTFTRWYKWEEWFRNWKEQIHFFTFSAKWLLDRNSKKQKLQVYVVTSSLFKNQEKLIDAMFLCFCFVDLDSRKEGADFLVWFSSSMAGHMWWYFRWFKCRSLKVKLGIHSMAKFNLPVNQMFEYLHFPLKKVTLWHFLWRRLNTQWDCLNDFSNPVWVGEK